MNIDNLRKNRKRAAALRRGGAGSEVARDCSELRAEGGGELGRRYYLAN